MIRFLKILLFALFHKRERYTIFDDCGKKIVIKTKKDE